MMHPIREHKIIRLTFLTAALLLVGGLFWIGAMPIAVGLFPEPLDKVAHFATFSMIACLLWLSLFRGQPILIIIIASAIGAADEIHQRFLPGRSSSFDDWATDFFAALVITTLLEYARRRRQLKLVAP